MGDIVKFVPKEKRKQMAADSETDKQAEKLDNFLNLDVHTEMLLALTKLKRRGILIERNINSRMVLVNKMTDDELFTRINRSRGQQWDRYPSFYAAVHEELDRRGLIPRKGNRTE
ncbi:MAG: hypothetical protein ACD_76C00109G0012 [uncultured bacterium]|nr:MAG: hypothetical protein ACD_76C00109G0012 [uncultured bacterium]HBD04897.1 hypothetical protein [Candidatus Uhrbacteria bacterium]